MSDARNRGDLVRALVARHYLGANLQAHLAVIEELATDNDQIAAAVDTIWRRCDYPRTGRIDPKAVKAELAVIDRFLEWCHYASADFLKEVGHVD